MKNIHTVLVFLFSCATVMGNPKKYTSDDSGFQPSSQPSPRRYNDSPLDLFRNDTRTSESHNRLQRFGAPPSSYGPPGPSGIGGPGYPSGTGLGHYPVKLDIGGIALGALLGLGVILVAPKIAQFLSGGYGGAYRSLDENESSISSILAKLDNTLDEHNIDSSSCMQRVICTYVHEAQQKMKSGESGPMDEFINALSTNPILTFMLDGSAVKQAIDMGKQNDPEKCASLYAKCPVSKENVTQVISTLLPSF